jgi:hypothetical protein
MLFSRQFGITKTLDDDWFDPILFTDTPLFIDPFLLYDGETGLFVGSHDEIIQFFNYLFQLIARSGGNPASPHWQKAEALLSLGEVYELCLGYSHGGTHGSGSGRELATQICRGLLVAIHQEVQQLAHFEEVQIFQEGIGPDRISDATAGIIRHRLAAYTATIAGRHRIPTERKRYFKSRFNFNSERWVAEYFDLPINPHSGDPILLVPQDYLRPLPTINPDDFWGYCYETETELIRRQFGEDITTNVDKSLIVQFARQHPDLRERYVRSKEHEGGEPYNLRTDPEGFYQPYLVGAGWAQQNALRRQINSDDDLFAAIQSFLAQFKTYVEDNGGWRLLWNDDGTAKREIAFQALLTGVIVAHCRANNIDPSKEANIGRGPVDFKFSQGYSRRVLLEAKLANNSRFWHGLREQLPTYLRAEQVQKGIFLVACQRDQDFNRLRDIRQIARQVGTEANVDISVTEIDCRNNPVSASLL